MIIIIHKARWSSVRLLAHIIKKKKGLEGEEGTKLEEVFRRWFQIDSGSVCIAPFFLGHFRGGLPFIEGARHNDFSATVLPCELRRSHFVSSFLLLFLGFFFLWWVCPTCPFSQSFRQVNAVMRVYTCSASSTLFQNREESSFVSAE